MSGLSAGPCLGQRVTVPVATLWRSPLVAGPATDPESDALLLADRPDVRAWAETLGGAGRLALHDRVDTQLLLGDVVEVREQRDDWSAVVVPGQPSSRDPGGYPGWVRTAHLGAGRDVDPAATAREALGLTGVPPAGVTTGGDLIRFARGLLGVRYAWGGCCAWAVDCSGLVHLAARCAGVRLPRDAHDQADSALLAAVDPAAALVGDLMFFGAARSAITHVGLVTGRDGQTVTMLHAPERGGEGRVEEVPLPRELADRLVAVGRLQDG